jgi:signal transduction histidine kinase
MPTKQSLNIDLKLFLALGKLALKLREEQDIDNLIKNCKTELEMILESKDIFFGVTSENELLIQEAPDNLQGLAYSENIFANLSQKEIAENDDFIFLPIKIKNKLCACLGIKKSNKLSEETILLLNTFAQSFSITLSEKQSLIDLQHYNEKLLKQDKAKTDLLCTISHELRTPMANILGFSELLNLKEFSKEETKAYQQEIYSAAIKLRNLIDNFLNLSRLESSEDLNFYNLEEVEIDWIADRAWESLKTESKNHELVFYIEENLPAVMVDIEAITRVFANLFSNAIKYSPVENKSPKKKIICKIGLEKNEILVSIIDEGIAIPDHAIETVFERFYRVDEHAKKNIGGTGLGLWICKKIIEAHQGRIWCSSEQNKGSTFFFTLAIQN